MPTPHSWKERLEGLRDDLGQVFGSRLLALLAYDTHFGVEPTAPEVDADHAHAMALVSSLTFADLTACAARMTDWAARRVGAPLILTREEFAHSLDAFPLEFAAIAHHHHVIAGADPFDAVQVAADDVRRACETQAKSHLLHLREGFLESGGEPTSVAGLVAASVPAFRTLLLGLARLDGVPTRGRETLIAHASGAIGVPAELLERVLALRRPQDLDRSDALKVYAAYLDAVERLASAIDGWKAR